MSDVIFFFKLAKVFGKEKFYRYMSSSKLFPLVPLDPSPNVEHRLEKNPNDVHLSLLTTSEN